MPVLNLSVLPEFVGFDQIFFKAAIGDEFCCKEFAFEQYHTRTFLAIELFTF